MASFPLTSNATRVKFRTIFNEKLFFSSFPQRRLSHMLEHLNVNEHKLRAEVPIRNKGAAMLDNLDGCEREEQLPAASATRFPTKQPVSSPVVLSTRFFGSRAAAVKRPL